MPLLVVLQNWMREMGAAGLRVYKAEDIQLLIRHGVHSLSGLWELPRENNGQN